MYDSPLFNQSASLNDLKIALAARAPLYNEAQGYSALHIAVLRPDAREAITLLLKYKADCNSVECTYGGTPLHAILANEDSELAEYFIDATEKAHQFINYTPPE